MNSRARLAPGDEMDLIVFASKTLPRDPELRIWRTFAAAAEEGVFSRMIVALPDGAEWTGPPLRCNFQLVPAAAHQAEPDMFADWARLLLAGEVPIYSFSGQASVQSTGLTIDAPGTDGATANPSDAP